MKKIVYLFVVMIVLAGVILGIAAPDGLSLAFVAIMCLVLLLGIWFGVLPVISFTNGLEAGQKSIQRVVQVQTDSAWTAVSQMNRFFYQGTLDRLFREYRDKVQRQREAGQIQSDIEEVINEDILALLSWRQIVGQIPGIMTGLGILGTFIGLLVGIRGVGFNTVEAALSTVQSILNGINIAFYTSISGVILSIIFNLIYNILWNMMSRELGVFIEDFRRYIVPDVDEQSRYQDRLNVQRIVKLLEEMPKDNGFSLSNGQQAGGYDGQDRNEHILMPQIQKGLKDGEFVFYLQPRYNLNTKKITGAEALVRWNHGSLGVVPPAVFIPALEKNGYITKLDQYIWEEVCKTIRQWIDSGLRPMPISLNVTKTDILAMDVVDFFEGMLKKYRIPPRYLDIEIAENAYLQSHGAVYEVEDRLQQAGFRVIVDGFDGDYMAFDSIQGVHTDTLKLDLRYFEAGPRLSAIQDVFEQARKLQLTVFAEGIENMEQLTALRKAGCTEGQGFYFSKPLSVEEFIKKMREG